MITGQKIVITGASSGIGKEILKLLCEGDNKIIAACRNASKISDCDGKVIPFSCDLSEEKGVDALFEKISETFDKVDLFIANAGAPYYEKYDYENWDRVKNIFNLNTVSPIYTFSKYLNHLNGREGRLVYTISAMGEMALPGYALYTATKFAMKGFQQAIRLEAPKNLKLTCVYPVSTDTNFFNVGGNGIKVEKPFPVQSADAVAKAVVSGVEKGKKSIYPCPVYLPSKALMTVLPPVRSVYWKVEQGRLGRFLKRVEQVKKKQ